ncbi:hypothetical protein K3495_g8993 [Podosphaera aphanis]|nr:hypothetical protein K3495_g8993 [Podosphaera aphanis]
MWHSNTFHVSPDNQKTVDQLYPTTRRPKRCEISRESDDIIERWFDDSKIEIGPLVRLVPGTKPYKARTRRRWTPNEQYWIDKTVSEGLKCGLFERTIEANGKFSDWNANQWPAEKSGTSGPNSELRFAVDYSHIEEQMPGCFLSLTEEVHDYLSFPHHKVFCQFDLKHVYWAFPLHPDDRHILAFFIPDVGQLQPCAMPQGTQSACYSMNEGMLRLWGGIPPLPKEMQTGGNDGSKPSLLEPGISGYPTIMSFYMDDLFHSS